MGEDEKTQVDRSAVFDLFTYLDYDASEHTGKTLGEVLAKSDVRQKCGSKDEYKQIVAAMEQDPSLKNCVFLGQSCEGSTEKITDGLIQGAAFQDPDGNLYVAYRGTGDGRWVDNGVGMTAEKTEMQEAAAEYFDRVVEEYHAEDMEGDIIVTGHSKGGNEAQYVTLASEHGDLIDACYSFDGQGFSDKAVNSFQNTLGKEEYAARLNKMYSICGENDYVHPLGRTVIPKDNTYYVGTSGELSLLQAHSLSNMTGTTGEDADYSGIQWAEADDNGGHGTRGLVGDVSETLSNFAMNLPEDQLDGFAKTTMAAVEAIFAVTGQRDIKHLGSYSLSVSDVLDFVGTILHPGIGSVKGAVEDLIEKASAGKTGGQGSRVISGQNTPQSRFVSADIGKLESFVTKSGEVIKEFDSIKQDFEEVNKTLLASWKGVGADTYRKKTDSILEKVGGIADVLDTLNEGVVKELIAAYKKTDRELYEYNINAGKEVG